MTTVSAQTILRSRNAAGPQPILSTLLWEYPRWIHAEGRTHRVIRIEEGFEIMIPDPSPMADPMLSRNAASSRAIPVRKMIEAIRNNPAIPLFWGKNVAGMQHQDELPKHLASKARDIWLSSMHAAIHHAEAMCNLGLDDDEKMIGAHKQIVNRMLEPYMHIKVLVSATEWNNFLALRLHGAAEPHIQLLARATADCLKDEPQELLPGGWHLPLTTVDECSEAFQAAGWSEGFSKREYWPAALDWLRKLSVARCASTSYLTVDGLMMTSDRATALHDRLVASDPLHASPAEHPAEADNFSELQGGGWRNKPLHANFVGFNQYRKMLPGEYVAG